MSGALDGLRVLEIGAWVFMPVVGAMLADMGADVIKLEDVIGGDPCRGSVAVKLLPPSKLNPHFEFANRNKRSVALNLKTKLGQQAIYRMVEKCDVVITSLLAPEKYGLDYETLSAINPRLIYGQAVYTGPKGEEKGKPGFDLLAAARGGPMSVLGEPGTPPVLILSAMFDNVAAALLCNAVLSALLARERSGKGQMVAVSLLGAVTYVAAANMQSYLLSGIPSERVSRLDRPNALMNAYRTKDNEWVCLCALPPARYWHDLCGALGLPEIEDDLRFSTDEGRTDNAPALTRILDARFATRTMSEWKDAFDSNGYFLYSKVKSYAEVAQDPQIIANDLIVEVEHPVEGRIKLLAFPMHLSQTPLRINSTAPEIGQHTEEVLLDFGYTWDDLLALRDEGTII